MEPELERRLHNIQRDQLLSLLQDLVARHPSLLSEVTETLNGWEAPTPIENEDDDEVTEDWDFSGSKAVIHTASPSERELLETASLREHIQGYSARLQQGEALQILKQDLSQVLHKIEEIANHSDSYEPLELYALLIEQRLDGQTDELVQLFDAGLDEAMPMLEMLLCEASSNMVFDSSSSTPLTSSLTQNARRRWLEQLFALWTKRLVGYRAESSLPELIMDVAWQEDMDLLRDLVQHELQCLRQASSSNIVEISQQYRVRILERFLKELIGN